MSSAAGLDEHVWNLTLDRDGKIVAAGDAVTATGGFDVALARFNADGTLDTSFGTAGKVTTAIGPGSRRDRAHDVAVMFALARYNADGTLDGSFGSGGIVTTAVAPGDNFDTASSVAIDPAGKIVAGGDAESGGFVFDWALVRYNPDGSLDNSFGTGGKVTTNVGPGNSDDDEEELVIQSTGRILIGGSVAPTAVTVDSDFAVARYNVDGTLDSSFGSGGIAVTNTAAGSGSDEIYEIALRSDAKLIVSGECDQATTGRDVCVARYKAGEGD
jgi:uncharacterized delta-60 repeat protein